MRSFSANPTVGGTASSVSDVRSPNYGALQLFIDKAAAYTQGRVKFSVVSWNASEPHGVIERGDAAPTPEQLEFRRVHDSILAYERRVHFAWKPTAFPAACKLPSKAPVAAQ